MIRLAFLAIAILAAAIPASAAGGPSFDCTAAVASDEKAICSSPELSDIDRAIADAYRGYNPEFGDAKAIARALLADRRACGADVPCIAAALYNALDTFVGISASPAWMPRYAEAMMLRKAARLTAGLSQTMPEKIGQCALTKIDALTTRFGEPLEGADAYSGTSVEFTNGGRQVSYGAVEALMASKVGQPVVLCLMAIPRDCPTGDDRGRLYLGLNPATQGTWVLPDSQHMCGGA